MKTFGPAHPYSYSETDTRSSFLKKKLEGVALKVQNVRNLNKILEILIYLRNLSKLPRALYLIRSCQIVLYNSGATLSGLAIESYLAKKMGKKVIFVFHGTDVRPVYLDGSVWGANNINSKELRRIAKKQKKLAQLAERTSDFIVAWSGITHFFSKPIYTHEDLGFPIPSVGVSSFAKSSDSRKLKIVHMPTNKAAKGTAEIERVIKHLQKKYQFDFDVVTGIPHDQAIEKLSAADIVIDQLYADSATGILAAEASMLQRPCIIASKDAEWFRCILGKNLPQTVFIHPEELSLTISNLLANDTTRLDSAKSAKNYFSTWDSHRVAQNYLEILSGTSDLGERDPLELNEPRGGFAPERDIKENLAGYINLFGESGLFLEHNTSLRSAIMQYPRS